MIRGLKSLSLRARLLTSLLAILLIGESGTEWFSYRDARAETNRLYDEELAQSADILIAIAAHAAAKTRIDLKQRDHGHPYRLRIAFQIWSEDKELILRTPKAGLEPLAPFEEGYQDIQFRDEAWRVFSRWDDDHTYLIQVGELQAVRDELAHGIAKTLLLPALLGIPLAGVLVWFAVSHGLKPLAILASELERRSPEAIHPITVPAIPKEILPLINALNHLFELVGRTLDFERRFTADAAHELRSPLAALKTHVQVALNAQTDAGRDQALRQAVTGVDRATRLIEQLLTLARVDPVTSVGAKSKFDLRGIVKECLARLAPMGMEKNIDVALAQGTACWVSGDEYMLEVLARNLIDNAIRYTPAGGTVEVSVSEKTGQVFLDVTDNGSGIPPEERSKVFGRFYRILGTGKSGSGLGLAIVERIARAHGATISLTDGENKRGLHVKVAFPSAP